MRRCSAHNSCYRHGRCTGPGLIWYAFLQNRRKYHLRYVQQPSHQPRRTELYNFLVTLQPQNWTTPPPKVVIFDSADPDFP